jgi:hypothetical protein
VGNDDAFVTVFYTAFALRVHLPLLPSLCFCSLYVTISAHSCNDEHQRRQEKTTQERPLIEPNACVLLGYRGSAPALVCLEIAAGSHRRLSGDVIHSELKDLRNESERKRVRCN